jgi:hypothetical protein
MAACTSCHQPFYLQKVMPFALSHWKFSFHFLLEMPHALLLLISYWHSFFRQSTRGVAGILHCCGNGGTVIMHT